VGNGSNHTLRAQSRSVCMQQLPSFLANRFARSMTGHWHDTVVCPSVFVTQCAMYSVALRVGLVRVPRIALSIHFFSHLCCRMYCLATKHCDWLKMFARFMFETKSVFSKYSC